MAIKKAPGYTGSGWSYGGATYKPKPIPVPKAAPAFRAPAYNPPQMPGLTAPVSSFGSYLPGVPAAQATAAAQPQAPSYSSQLAGNPYVGELTSDPMYGLGIAQRDATLNALGAARQTANQQAVIAGGYAPGEINASALGEYGGDITPETIAAAGQNQFSTKAQLAKGLGQQMSGMPYDLARRGATRSGAAQTHATAFNEQFQSQSNQAMQSLAQQLSGNVTNYLSGRTQAEQSWLDQQQQIASRLAQAAGYSRATDENGNPLPEEELISPGEQGLGGTSSVAGRAALSSPNPVIRARAAASAGFISPMPRVNVTVPKPAVQKAIAAVRKKK